MIYSSHSARGAACVHLRRRRRLQMKSGRSGGSIAQTKTCGRLTAVAAPLSGTSTRLALEVQSIAQTKNALQAHLARKEGQPDLRRIFNQAARSEFQNRKSYADQAVPFSSQLALPPADWIVARCSRRVGFFFLAIYEYGSNERTTLRPSRFLSATPLPTEAML
jgi:hypothetical protein